MVSIIVPIYKVEKYLRECIDSILAQTYEDIEVILIDDGSPDGSPAICDEYASKDKRVKVIHKPNGGLSDARNAGLDKAHGDYISFIDSDDVIDKLMIEIMMEHAADYSADIIGCESEMFDETSGAKTSIYHSTNPIQTFNSSEYADAILYKKVDCSACNKIYKRELIGNHRFLKGRYNEDILFLLEIIHKTNTVVQINDAFYHYRITVGSVSHTFNERSLDLLKNIDNINEIVSKYYPKISESLFSYTCKSVKTIATSIIRNRKSGVEPFCKALNESRSYLKSNYFKILKSDLFDMRMKLAVTLILLIK